MERLFIVCYDIRDPRRWRRVFRILKGYGEWLQLSVFQCRLDAAREVTLQAALGEVICAGKDHVLLIDVGSADAVTPRFQSLGKSFQALGREPMII